jgi:hypothetical protein
MASKKDIIKEIDTLVNKPTYSKSEVKHLITSVSSESVNKPSTLKIGDVFVNLVGGKNRPIVIVKVLGDVVLGVPLSTTEDCLNLLQFKSRFFGNNYFSKQVVITKYELAMSNFTGVFDSPRDLKKAKEMLKQFYIDNL